MFVLFFFNLPCLMNKVQILKNQKITCEVYFLIAARAQEAYSIHGFVKKKIVWSVDVHLMFVFVVFCIRQDTFIDHRSPYLETLSIVT